MKIIIFNSELEFRDYLIQNSNRIIQLIIFEDKLDELMIFYCFLEENLLISAKESSINNFSEYRKIYKKLAKDFDLILNPYIKMKNVMKFESK